MSAFVGSYVPELCDVLIASAMARQNAVILGSPGWGKTAISRSLARHLVGDQFSFIRIDPSTPPDVIRGAYNPADLLNGQLVRVTTGTPYDPAMRLGIIDEIGRGNEVTFDALLDTLDRLDDPDAPSIWATSNFMPTGDRIAALIDRFALWYWVQPGTMDVAALTGAQLNGSGGPQVDPAGLPTWDQILDVRSATPGPKAVKAVGDLLNKLTTEAITEGRQVHPRRVAQWSHLVYRLSVWHSGQADFDSVPAKAARILAYAWPAITPEEQASWKEITTSTADPAGAVIEAEMRNVLVKMQEVASLPTRERNAHLPALGSLIQQSQANLERVLGEDDERVTDTIVQMQQWFAAASSGQPIE